MKRILSLFCALFMVIQLCPLSANTVLSGVYLISVDDDLIPPTQRTMPFWSDGQLYVPYTVFQGLYSDSLGVSYTLTVDPNVVILFDQNGRVLAFNLSTNEVQDENKNSYPMSAKVNNGAVFFPVDPVTDYFGLTYTYNYTDIVPLIRIKSDDVVLSDSRFISVAEDLMRLYYNRYEKEVGGSSQQSPDTPVIHTGQWVYPVFTVTDAADTAQLAAALFRREMQATFLMTPGQMQQETELLRSLVGMKQGIGIVPDPEGNEPVADQLARANEALWQAACSTTRMVWSGKKTAWSGNELEQMGYCSMECLLDYSASPLTSSSRAETVYKQLSAIAGKSLTLYLGSDTGNTAGINRLLTLLDEGDCRVLAWRETL